MDTTSVVGVADVELTAPYRVDEATGVVEEAPAVDVVDKGEDVEVESTSSPPETWGFAVVVVAWKVVDVVVAFLFPNFTKALAPDNTVTAWGLLDVGSQPGGTFSATV